MDNDVKVRNTGEKIAKATMILGILSIPCLLCPIVALALSVISQILYRKADNYFLSYGDEIKCNIGWITSLFSLIISGLPYLVRILNFAAIVLTTICVVFAFLIILITVIV